MGLVADVAASCSDIYVPMRRERNAGDLYGRPVVRVLQRNARNQPLTPHHVDPLSPSGALPSDRSPVTHLCRSRCLISYLLLRHPETTPTPARCFSTCRTLAPSVFVPLSLSLSLSLREAKGIGEGGLSPPVLANLPRRPSRCTRNFRNLCLPLRPSCLATLLRVWSTAGLAVVVLHPKGRIAGRDFPCSVG